MPLGELKNETRFPRLLILPQNKTEQLFYEALRKENSVQVKFSSEVTRMTQSKSAVCVEYLEHNQTVQAEAAYVTGCDGAHSSVRHFLGLSLSGMTYASQAALADIRLGKKQDYEFPRLTNQGVLAIAILIEKDLWRLILPFGASSDLPPAKRLDQSVRQLFKQENYEVIWQSEFHLHRRISSDFVRGRVALAGDSAHLNSPVGGQGMNAGIQDAEVLCAVLRQAIDKNDPSVLKNYEQQRYQTISKGINPFTNQLTKVLLFSEGKYIKLVLKTVNLFLRFKPLRHPFLERLAMLK